MRLCAKCGKEAAARREPKKLVVFCRDPLCDWKTEKPIVRKGG